MCFFPSCLVRGWRCVYVCFLSHRSCCWLVGRFFSSFFSKCIFLFCSPILSYMPWQGSHTYVYVGDMQIYVYTHTDNRRTSSNSDRRLRFFFTSYRLNVLNTIFVRLEMARFDMCSQLFSLFARSLSVPFCGESVILSAL